MLVLVVTAPSIRWAVTENPKNRKNPRKAKGQEKQESPVESPTVAVVVVERTT